MPLTPNQEREIFPLLDAVLELDIGKGLLRTMSTPRADYMARMIKGYVFDAAIESLEICETGDPLYGKGAYATIWAEVHERGLLLTRLQHPPSTLMWQLIACAATQQPIDLDSKEAIGRQRQRLARAQEKYPDIMGNVWIQTEPRSAYYGEIEDEESVIVDIDVGDLLRTNNRSDQIARLRKTRSRT